MYDYHCANCAESFSTYDSCDGECPECGTYTYTPFDSYLYAGEVECPECHYHCDDDNTRCPSCDFPLPHAKRASKCPLYRVNFKKGTVRTGREKARPVQRRTWQETQGVAFDFTSIMERNAKRSEEERESRQSRINRAILQPLAKGSY